MKTATVTAFRARMKEHLEEIQDSQDILILSGPKNNDFVVMTLEEYNAMEETVHLLSTTANANRLLESIAQDKAGAYKPRKLPVKPGTKAKKKKI